MHKDIMPMIDSFYHHNIHSKGLNSLFIALIPKSDHPKLVLDYRLISLINSMLKILLKNIANRLGNFLHHLVFEEQTAFVKGRQISDDILIINEVAHIVQSNEVQGLILKLDFSKAFDSSDWMFLLELLDRMGFKQR